MTRSGGSTVTGHSEMEKSHLTAQAAGDRRGKKCLCTVKGFTRAGSSSKAEETHEHSARSAQTAGAAGSCCVRDGGAAWRCFP